MTHVTKQDHLQLLARARAALETPADLDAAAIADLIEDIAAAEARLEAHAVPWSLDVHIGQIEHEFGTNLYATLSRETLMAEIGVFCRDYWSQVNDSRDPSTMSDEEVSAEYFNLHPEDNLATERISLDGPETIAAAPYEIERLLVLSTGHLSDGTGKQLTAWADCPPETRPLDTADTSYGWLVQSRALAPDERAGLPSDLTAAQALGRRLGCGHILFDRDASPLDVLEWFAD